MSVWLHGDERPRRPRLSRERIVQAAVGLLDAECVDGFSMRRLAARLGAGTMSLYEYVSAKEDVLDLALDEALAEIELDDSPDDSWRDVVVRQMTRYRRVMRRHPWVPVLVGTRPLLGPNALARSERVYGALNEAGLSGPELTAAVSAVSGYVHGYVVQEIAWRARLRDPRQETDLRRQAQQHIARKAELYPTLSRQARLEDSDFDSGFTLGLQIVLDGIEAQLTS